MNELNFIKYLTRSQKKPKSAVVGIGDDTAVLKYTSGKYLLYASDMVIEGSHFRKGTDPYCIGWKAAACNISDCAAMGGVPKYITISAGVPAKGGLRTLKRIIDGASDVCKKFGAAVIGGDTNKSDRIVVDVSVIGEVEKNRLVTRSGAKVNDLIFITGPLGLGREKHLSFMPRVKEARFLTSNFSTNSMIDVSDGLYIDLSRICERSGVGSRIYRSYIRPGKQNGNFEDVNYGEDFELLFTLSVNEAKKLMKLAPKHGFYDFTLIGEIAEKSSGSVIVMPDGKIKDMKPEGYEHF